MTAHRVSRAPRSVVGFAAVAVTLVVGAALAASATAWARAGSPEGLDAIAASSAAPGLAIRTVDSSGRVLESTARGVDGNGAPVGDGSPFAWGSVSKSAAAAVVAGVERDGLLDRSRPVVDIVPAARAMLGDSAATVDDLIHHTSGLPHDITETDDWSRRGSATDAVAAWPRPEPLGPRGTFRYSSLGYLLVQAVVESATAGSYGDALERYVLTPSGATGIVHDVDTFERVVPPGTVPFFTTDRRIDVGVDAAGFGYGYLAGSVDDLGRYAAWRLRGLREGTGGGTVVPTSSGDEYGDGLYRSTIGGHEVWWHSGSVPGYFTSLAFVPDLDRAVVAVTDRYGELDGEQIAYLGRVLAARAADAPVPPAPSSTAANALRWGAVGVVGVAVLLLLLVVRRMFRRQGRRSAGSFVVGAVAATFVAVALGRGPALLGIDARALWRWAPDVALTAGVLVAVVAAIAVAALADGVRASVARRTARPVEHATP